MRLKKVKDAFQRIEASPYFVHDPTKYIGKWSDVFKNSHPIYVEIGMGKGDFIIEMSRRHPNINFIGMEMYDSVLVKATEKLKTEESLDNLRLILIDAGNIEQVFDKEISRIYLNFSDPWPKKRHTKRRLTSAVFLEKYEHIFKSKKEVFMKTDNNDLFEFSMEMLLNFGYKLSNVTRNLHENSSDEIVMTEYEKKFVAKGVLINSLEASKN